MRVIISILLLISCGRGGDNSSQEPVVNSTDATDIDSYEVISIAPSIFSHNAVHIDAKTDHPNLFLSGYEVIIIISKGEPVANCQQESINEDSSSEISPTSSGGFTGLDYDAVYGIRACIVDPYTGRVTPGITAKFKTKPEPDYLKPYEPQGNEWAE